MYTSMLISSLLSDILYILCDPYLNLKAFAVIFMLFQIRLFRVSVKASEMSV